MPIAARSVKFLLSLTRIGQSTVENVIGSEDRQGDLEGTKLVKRPPKV